MCVCVCVCVFYYIKAFFILSAQKLCITCVSKTIRVFNDSTRNLLISMQNGASYCSLN